MSLAIALAQIQLPPSYACHGSKTKSEIKFQENKERRKELLNLIRNAGRQVSLAECAEAMDASISSIRNLSASLIIGGKVERVKMKDGRVGLEAV